MNQYLQGYAVLLDLLPKLVPHLDDWVEQLPASLASIEKRYRVVSSNLWAEPLFLVAVDLEISIPAEAMRLGSSSAGV